MAECSRKGMNHLMNHLHMFENIHNVNNANVSGSLFFSRIFNVIKVSDRCQRSQTSKSKGERMSRPGRAIQPCVLCYFSWLKTLQSKAANLVCFVNADLNLQGFEVMSF